MGSDGSSRIELRLAGTFGVIRDGIELPDGEVGSRKSRTLLKLLAVERPGLVPLERIVEVLWGGLPPAAAEQNVASLVSRLRGALGPDVIKGGRPGYRLAGSPTVSVDLDAAAGYCDQAERKLAASPGLALATAEQAIALMAAGTALADEPYSAWAEPARDELRGQLRRARLAAAEAALAADDTRTAIRHAEAAMAADPLDETAHRWYMAACAAAGDPARALVAYAGLRERLAEELGADPAPQTQDLYLAVLRASSPGERIPGPPTRPSRRTQPTRRELAGRAAETAALREAWGRAVTGAASVVAIVGEAGIGKTALAEDIAAEAAASGATVLRTRCYEAERSLFLQPIVEAMTPVVARMTASALRELLGEHAGRGRPAARGGRPARARPGVARQPGHGTAPVLPGRGRVPGRVGGPRTRLAGRRRPAVRGAINRRVHPLPRPAKPGRTAARGGDRPGRARPAGQRGSGPGGQQGRGGPARVSGGRAAGPRGRAGRAGRAARRAARKASVHDRHRPGCCPAG